MKNLNNFENKNFGILGLGISGLASLEFLLNFNNINIFLSDSKSLEALCKNSEKLKNILELNNLNNKIKNYEFGTEFPESFLRENLDYIIISPSISQDSKILLEARKKNIKIITEIELAYLFFNKLNNKLNNNLIAITGTNGKSTVTAWTAHMLETIPCGNIGTPVCELANKLISEININNKNNFNLNNFLVCELSSFQLSHSCSIKPKISAILNLTPDHIYWHGSLEEYFKAKQKITSLQDTGDYLLIPDNQEFLSINTQAQKIFVQSCLEKNTKNNFNNLIFLENKTVYLKLNNKITELFELSDISLLGEHNIKNAMFSAGMAYIAGISPKKIKEKIQSFKGLAHRIEFIGELKNKKFYNDSKATNPDSTIIALNSFAGDITLLAGGRDKNTSLELLVNISKSKIKNLILFGEAKERFKQEFLKYNFTGNIFELENLEQAMKKSLELDSKIVLLSPACASFDQFANFEARGDSMKEIFRKLKTVIF